MKVFGPIPWGAAVNNPELMVPTPVGNNCIYCEETVADGDAGLVMPYIHSDTHVSVCVWHRECYMRDLYGSVAHQHARCSCFGGIDEDDPPGMTRRQAAREAAALATGKRAQFF